MSEPSRKRSHISACSIINQRPDCLLPVSYGGIYFQHSYTPRCIQARTKIACRLTRNSLFLIILKTLTQYCFSSSIWKNVENNTYEMNIRNSKVKKIFNLFVLRFCINYKIYILRLGPPSFNSTRFLLTFQFSHYSYVYSWCFIDKDKI